MPAHKAANKGTAKRGPLFAKCGSLCWAVLSIVVLKAVFFLGTVQIKSIPLLKFLKFLASSSARLGKLCSHTVVSMQKEYYTLQ